MTDNRAVLDMSDDEFNEYTQGYADKLQSFQTTQLDTIIELQRLIYGNPSDRAWSIIIELRKHGMSKQTSYGFPLLYEGVGAFCEDIAARFPDMEAKRIVDLIVRQGLTDFVVASESYSKATKSEKTA